MSNVTPRMRCRSVKRFQEIFKRKGLIFLIILLDFYSSDPGCSSVTGCYKKPLGSVKCDDFLDQMSDYELLNKDSALRTSTTIFNIFKNRHFLENVSLQFMFRSEQ